jgi:hypothetical protein
MSHAFYAEIGVNHENLFSLGNGLGRALRLAGRAGDAGFVNGHGHGKSPQTLEQQDAAAGPFGTAPTEYTKIGSENPSRICTPPFPGHKGVQAVEGEKPKHDFHFRDPF